MLTIFRDRAKGMEISPAPEQLPQLLAEAIWVDALNPTAEEKAAIEKATGLYVSTPGRALGDRELEPVLRGG